MAAAPPLPSFLIVGAQKCGTVWLATNLAAHPDVFVPRHEPMFFNSEEHHPRGLDWYRDQFVGWGGEPIVGESTAGYLMPLHRPALVAERIDAALPEVRLLAILRNPVDRAQSAMVHHMRRRRLPADTRLVDYVAGRPAHTDPLGLVMGGLYAQSLQPFVDQFGARLLVLLLDDIAADPTAPYRRALHHIGATSDFTPADLATVRHTHQAPIHDAEPPGWLAAAGRAKRAVLRQSRAVGEVRVPPLTPAERAELFAAFADDVAALEVLLGRSLAAWRPDA